MPALQLLHFEKRTDLTSVPAEHVKDLRLEDYKVAQMFHHADVDTKLAVLHQLCAHYLSPDGYFWSHDVQGFAPADRWWCRETWLRREEEFLRGVLEYERKLAEHKGKV